MISTNKQTQHKIYSQIEQHTNNNYPLLTNTTPSLYSQHDRPRASSFGLRGRWLPRPFHGAPSPAPVATSHCHTDWYARRGGPRCRAFVQTPIAGRVCGVESVCCELAEEPQSTIPHAEVLSDPYALPRPQRERSRAAGGDCFRDEWRPSNTPPCCHQSCGDRGTCPELDTSTGRGVSNAAQYRHDTVVQPRDVCSRTIECPRQ